MLDAVTLVDGSVVLRPMRDGDAEPLARAAAPHADSFAYLGTRPDDPRYVPSALEARARGEQLPFVVELDGRPVGSTRYGDIRERDGALEIGWTWYLPEVRGTRVNPAAKRLLLAHAFETLGMQRVQLKTDARNERSQRAITALGAVREGVLRRHMRMPDGFVRDTVMFSIVAPEWPAVRARLDARLAALPHG